ncbi:MAG: Gfo/Idh/MocA family oxidoreductase [Verrucomicrobia bacterium]|nr:Gfo/Idh/MocA family oxidoreductase [Verrucomicrobiota bacterium]
MKSHVSLSRRSFLKQLGLTGLAAPWVTRDLLAASPNSILRHASCGASGMAWSDINAITESKFVRLVAVADVDLNRTADVRKKFPSARIYQDWRVLLEKEWKNLDSVNVTVPDHMHAAIGMSALDLGKNVYGQKPLAHDLYEVRQLTRFAREKGVVTQMGIQIHSESEYRLAVRLIRELTIGKVREVHSWSEKKWGDANPRPDRSDPIPAGFNWDWWLGTAAQRPFIGEGYYHPTNWRKRLDFGTGTFGDMGCHIFDPVFDALALTAPVSVRSEGPAPNAYNWATDAVIHYVFPGTPYTEGQTIHVHWYDGDQRPPNLKTLLEGDPVPGQGSLFIGTDGLLLLPHIARPQLYPIAKFEGHPMPPARSQSHWIQFVEACRGNGKTSAGFDYAGPLTEAVLLGSVATHFPQTTLEWHAADLRFTNQAEANRFVRRTYRQGWEIRGL